MGALERSSEDGNKPRPVYDSRHRKAISLPLGASQHVTWHLLTVLGGRLISKLIYCEEILLLEDRISSGKHREGIAAHPGGSGCWWELSVFQVKEIRCFQIAAFPHENKRVRSCRYPLPPATAPRAEAARFKRYF